MFLMNLTKSSLQREWQEDMKKNYQKKSYQSEIHLGPPQTSKMELLTKIIK